ncbi:hypothetical protein AOLI_G00002490 [Acnodon oligacanthus]
MAQPLLSHLPPSQTIGPPFLSAGRDDPPLPPARPFRSLALQIMALTHIDHIHIRPLSTPETVRQRRKYRASSFCGNLELRAAQRKASRVGSSCGQAGLLRLGAFHRPAGAPEGTIARDVQVSGVQHWAFLPGPGAPESESRSRRGDHRGPSAVEPEMQTASLAVARGDEESRRQAWVSVKGTTGAWGMN